jgi:hypothetical protein
VTILIKATDDLGAVAAANAAVKAFITIRYIERHVSMSLSSDHHAVSFMATPTDLDGLHFHNIRVLCLQTGRTFAVSYEYDDDTGNTIYTSTDAEKYGVHEQAEVIPYG